MFTVANIKGIEVVVASFYDRKNDIDRSVNKQKAEMTLEDWHEVLSIVKDCKYADLNKETCRLIEDGTYSYTCADGVERVFSTKTENQRNASAQAAAIGTGLIDPAVNKIRFEHNEKKGAYYQFQSKMEFLQWWITGMSTIDDILFRGKDIKAQVELIGKGETDIAKFEQLIATVMNFEDHRSAAHPIA